jgi:hypothetical protein
MHRDHSVTTWRAFSTLLLVFVCLAALIATLDLSQALVEAQRRPPTRARKPAVDYKSFSHTTHVATQKMACKDCHTFPSKNWKEVRKGDDAFQDVAEFPEHSACLKLSSHAVFCS